MNIVKKLPRVEKITKIKRAHEFVWKRARQFSIMYDPKIHEWNFKINNRKSVLTA